MLIFNCPTHLLGAERSSDGPGGVWFGPADSSVGPFDVQGARLLTDERLYVGKLLQNPHGEWVLIAFANYDEPRHFVGELIDPVPAR